MYISYRLIVAYNILIHIFKVQVKENFILIQYDENTYVFFNIIITITVQIFTPLHLLPSSIFDLFRCL